MEDFFLICLCRPNGLVSYTAFPVVLVIRMVGDPAPLFFLNLWPRPRILLFLDPRFEEFTVPSLDDFVNGDWDESCHVPFPDRAV